VRCIRVCVYWKAFLWLTVLAMGIRKDLLVTEEIAESSDLRATPFEFELEQERMQFQTRGMNRTTRAELA
jgi:hypothetical protein